jgi:type VI secretion system protein ImpH
MAAEVRRADPPIAKEPPLAEVLFERAYSFRFFQAVRLLERMSPGRAPVGRHGDPGREVARFRSRPSLEFPASEIHEIQPGRDGAPPSVKVAFMGLVGPVGALPVPYTELAAERARHRDPTLWEFLDLFGHRLVSLFYRAWEKYRFAIAYERGEEDKFTGSLFGMVGLGTRGLRGRTSLPDEAFLYYGGLVAQRPHSASALAAAVADYFGVPAEVEQFRGQWLELDGESMSRLGSANSSLGVSTVAGSRVWDVQSKFRLRFGPLTLAEFEGLLPSGSAFRMVADAARFFAGPELDFDMQLVLQAAEVPPCRLAAGGGGPRLGWTSWLKTREFERDDSQVVLCPG